MKWLGAPVLFLLVLAVYSAAFADDAGVGASDAGADPLASLDIPDAGPSEEMAGVLDEAMKKIAVSRGAEARRMFKKRDYPGALSRYREAHDLDPQNPEIANNLGYIYYLLGNPEEAERLYRWTLNLDPERYIVHINLADLLTEHEPDEERLEEAAALLVQARQLKGNVPRVILRQARVAAQAGSFPDAERFYLEYLSQRRPTDKLKLELGDFYRDLGRVDEALEWFRKVEGEDLGKEAAGRIWDIEVEKQTRAFGWSDPAGAIPPGARALDARARSYLAAKDYDEAERLLEEALNLAPGFSTARADLGDLYYRTDRPKEAELAYLQALAMDRGNADLYVRLADLYMSSDDRAPRFAEAAIFLSRALEIRPDWHHLRLELAEASRGAGDLIGALAQVERFLESGSGKDKKRALSLKRSIEALIPPGAMADPSRGEDALGAREEMSEELRHAMGAARAHLARGETDSAMAVLKSLPKEERGADVLNLEARILVGAGRMDEAASSLRASLREDPEQAVVHEQLGAILVGLGETASGRVHLLRAEELGNLEAIYHLAKLEAGDGHAGVLSWTVDVWRIPELLEARERLARFSGAAPMSVYNLDSKDLRAELDDRLWVLVAAGVSIVVILIIGVAVLLRRFWGGADLRTLIERHPETGPEVQRVLSAIRHEVLKHNTMMLGGLVDSMEAGRDVGEMARHFHSSITGKGEEGGIVNRLGTYVDALERIGDANRKRLNLVRKDAAMAPILRGARLLDASARALARYDGLSSGARRSLLRDLKTASRLLNTQGYEAVRALLDKLRILKVDAELLEGIFARCVGEPAFAGVRIAPLALDVRMEVPFGVPIPKAAFEDILTNLMRNALQSSVRHGDPGATVEIGLGVETEVDEITGIERLLLKVRDRSREDLTAEMLRGRYIEEGLGLTADLVSRYDGTMDVARGDDGWTKAAVVKLPLAELSELDREDTRRFENER